MRGHQPCQFLDRACAPSRSSHRYTRADTSILSCSSSPNSSSIIRLSPSCLSARMNAENFVKSSCGNTIQGFTGRRCLFLHPVAGPHVLPGREHLEYRVSAREARASSATDTLELAGRPECAVVVRHLATCLANAADHRRTRGIETGPTVPAGSTPNSPLDTALQ